MEQEKTHGTKFHIFGWKVKWGKIQEDAFTDLRAELANPTLLVACEYGKRKRLITDASGVGYGAVLLQEQSPDDFRPVMFLSRKLKGPETRYTATENEAGAIIFALRQLRAYLDGEKFEIFTDHIALKWLLDMQHPRPRLARWLLELQDFDFSVNYAPGNSEMLTVPDALSRYSSYPSTILCNRFLEVAGEIYEGDLGGGKSDQSSD